MKEFKTALPNWESPQFTIKSITDDVIRTAIERRGYGESVSLDTARNTAYHQLRGSAVWDDELEAFGKELQGAGEDFDEAKENPYGEVCRLATEVFNVIKEDEVSQYLSLLNPSALKDAVCASRSKISTLIFSSRPEWVNHMANLVAALVVAGKCYVEEEMTCELEAVDATVDEIIQVADVMKTLNLNDYADEVCSLLHGPLSVPFMKAQFDSIGYVAGSVEVELSKVIGCDLEEFLDMLSYLLTGSTCLGNIDYGIIGHTENTLTLKVTGDAAYVLEEEDDNNGE